MFSAGMIGTAFVLMFVFILAADGLEDFPDRVRVFLWRIFLALGLISAVYCVAAGIYLAVDWPNPFAIADPDQTRDFVPRRRRVGLFLLAIRFWPYVLAGSGLYFGYRYAQLLSHELKSRGSAPAPPRMPDAPPTRYDPGDTGMARVRRLRAEAGVDRSAPRPSEVAAGSNPVTEGKQRAQDSYAAGPPPRILKTTLEAAGATVFAIDVTDALEFYRARLDMRADSFAAVGRLMSAAAAMGLLHPGARKVTVTANGDGPVAPVYVALRLTDATYAISLPPPEPHTGPDTSGRLSPSTAVGTSGTLAVEIWPAGGRHRVPFARGEIADELSDLMAHRLGCPPAAMMMGEYIGRDGVSGSGLILMYYDRTPPTDPQYSAVEHYVGRFGRLYEHIRAGESPEQWLAVFSNKPPQPVQFQSADY